jgi:predicted Zn-ribbon and HTH transcriptional regulator
MKKKAKEPAIPSERHETVRQSIISLLEGKKLSAKEISPEVGISEKMAYDHLEHIRKRKELKLVIEQAVCRKCGFEFKKRERLKRPGRCPACRGEFITEPLFSIKVK